MTQFQVNTDSIAEKAFELLTVKSATILSLFSVGCGDGRFDKVMLTKQLSKLPNLTIHYLGMKRYVIYN